MSEFQSRFFPVFYKNKPFFFGGQKRTKKPALSLVPPSAGCPVLLKAA
jgi:hypothetical protein